MKEIQIAHQKLTIHELDDVCDSATGRALTGSWLWNSALMLAEWLATQSQRHHFDFHSKSVIELGAGTGLPGLTAALLGASRVVLTDVELLLPCLLRNVEANGLGDRVEVRGLVWKSEDSASETERLDKFDVVLMSDVFFDQDEMGPLADTIKRLCRRDTEIWGAAEVRPWTGECLNEFTSRGFEVLELAIQLGLTNSSMGEEGESEVFTIFNLTPPHEENQAMDKLSSQPSIIIWCLIPAISVTKKKLIEAKKKTLLSFGCFHFGI